MSTFKHPAQASNHRLSLIASSLAVVLCVGVKPTMAQTLTAANPITATLPSTDFSLQLEQVIQLPDSGTGSIRFARIEQISPAADGSGALFVADQRGKVYSFTPGDATPTEFFDFGANIPNFRNGNGQSGLRGFAFHPDVFSDDTRAPGYLKMYTAHEIDTNGSESHLSVVSEWTLTPSGNSVIPSSRRDVLTQTQPRGDHNIGKIGFNPNLSPGDPDYGNLYISFGDGGNFATPGDTTLNPNGQDRTNFLGSLLRINPLQSGADDYAIPADNPFVGENGVKEETWAYGLRNPHQFSWDTGGSGHMLIADIGQSNIEEVNLGVKGANYGWSEREGTFDMSGKLPVNPIAADVLPPGHATDPFTYPVVQYDHDFANDGQKSAAIAGGFVYRGTQVPELRGKYLFGNFGSFGRFGETQDYQDLYVVDVDQLQLQDDFTNLDLSSTDAFLAPMQILNLEDSQGQPMSLLDLVRETSGISTQNRTDMRFGIDANGELYVSSKRTGVIWRFVSTLKPGDYNLDAAVNASDYALWRDGASPDDSITGYEAWSESFELGSANASLNAAAIPEPRCALLLVVGCLTVCSAAPHRV